MILPSLFILYALLFIKESIFTLNITSKVHTYDTGTRDFFFYFKYSRLARIQNSNEIIGGKFYHLLPPNATSTNFKNFKRVYKNGLQVKHFISMNL